MTNEQMRSLDQRYRLSFKDMFARLQRRIERFKRTNIKDSIVSHPHLIDPTAQVTGAHLVGPVRVAEHALIRRDTLLRGRVVIGRYTAINGPNTDILSEIHAIEIGAFCSIARNVAIQEYNHRYTGLSTCFVMTRVLGEEGASEIESEGPIVIGNDVWVGTQTVILSGSVIGHGAVIGANSVVNAQIPPYAVAAGVPARVIRFRFPEPIVERVLALRWWNWPYEEIRRNRTLFAGDLTEEKLEEFEGNRLA